ncbi:MAG: glycolate oxidase subunit GlcF [Hyphomicrobiales bacterium]|nr:glycolate oxidase subunit GlcF [Hyphomicrobiales bacterium]
MQTRFTPEQLARPLIREADGILRKCVHCGFCTATCPTFVLLGDELDSPRGRIYLIKDMLENDRPATEKVVRHLDRCLSCLSCTTTCPSGVDYMHLIDGARVHVARSYRRPLGDRLLRRMLAWTVPFPKLFRLSLVGAKLGRPFRALMPGRLKGMVAMAPRDLPSPSPVDRPQVFPAQGRKVRRVALMTGCAQQVLRPAINEATVRLLTRHGCEVVVPAGAGCCGALVHHMGEEAAAQRAAQANVAAWERVAADGGLDAIVVNASGCGTTVKDYGHLLKDDPAWADRAAAMAALARDVSEVLAGLDLAPGGLQAPPAVTYHAACSLQHGQKITTLPKDLLRGAGFTVAEPREGHLCCGSAGTYNMLQPDLADRLKARKVANIAATAPQVVATGNIGCLVQLSDSVGVPVVHTVELLDWATGGPRPHGI